MSCQSSVPAETVLDTPSQFNPKPSSAIIPWPLGRHGRNVATMIPSWLVITAATTACVLAVAVPFYPIGYLSGYPVGNPSNSQVLTAQDEGSVSFFASARAQAIPTQVIVGQQTDSVSISFTFPRDVQYRILSTRGNFQVDFDQRGEFDLEIVRQALITPLESFSVQQRPTGSRITIAISGIPAVRDELEGRTATFRFSPGAGQAATSLFQTTDAGTTPNAEDILSQDLDDESFFNEVDSTEFIDEGSIIDDVREIARQENEFEILTDDPTQSEPDAVIVFQFEVDAAASFFRRGAYYWAVFDAPTRLDLTPLRAAGGDVIRRIEQLPSRVATVVRMRVDSIYGPVVRRRGFDWHLFFRKIPNRPSQPIPINFAINEQQRLSMTFDAPDSGNVVLMIDPEIGDQITVGTVRAPGLGISGQRIYPEFDLLGSVQGVAVIRRAERLQLVSDEAGFSLTVEEGLIASAIAPVDDPRAVQNVQVDRLFLWDQWNLDGGLNYHYTQKRLIRAIPEQLGRDRTEAWMDLARYEIITGHGREAYGIFRIVEGEDGDYANREDFRALKGVAALLGGSPLEALDALADPRLNNIAEAALWRGAAFAALGRMKQASIQFRISDHLLRRYPRTIRTPLLLYRIETALASRSIQASTLWTETLEKDIDYLNPHQINELRYQQGRLLIGENRLAEAISLWQKISQSGDLKNSARARFSLINLAQRQGTLTTDQATEALERMRFSWRGDRLELSVLIRLADLYISERNYLPGMLIYESALNYFGNDPITARVEDDLATIFRRIFLEGEAEFIPPLRAVVIFNHFRHLTPEGEDGLIVLRQLADRLVAIDLLNRADTLLDYLQEFRASGYERAEIGARLAEVRIMNYDPKGALIALNNTDSKDADLDLNIRRNLLSSEAQFRSNNHADALGAIIADLSPEADNLRMRIYWAQGDWPNVARVAQRLVGEPDDLAVPLDEKTADLLLKWATALQISDNSLSLQFIRDQYGTAMAQSGYGNAFAYLSDYLRSEINQLDLISRGRIVARKDGFDDFFANYQDVLAKPVFGSSQ